MIIGGLPNSGIDLRDYQEPMLSPSYTYKVDLDNKHTAGYVDNEEALKQAIIFALKTEQGKYEIYPDDYGMELDQLIGVHPSLAKARLPSLIEECLMQDLRIDTVEVTDIQTKDNILMCRVTCNGNIDVDYEVEI